MMKFFRKYNKHLLAVFMALLLVIWLGGDALRYFVQPDPGSKVLGTAVTGDILRRDTEQARQITELQRMVNIDWQGSFNDPSAPSDEQLNYIDWVLLVREAKKYGIVVRPGEAKRLLAARRIPERYVQQVAARQDVTAESIYAAAAQYFTVEQLLMMFQASVNPTEPELRRFAKDNMERVTIEMVRFPAKSFADPNETFSEEELQTQFDAHRTQHAGEGLNFGYYIEPKVRIQYIKIDPQQIKDELRGSDKVYERRAFTYWQENKETDPRFRRSPEEMKAAMTQPADTGTNGEVTPPPKPYYENFADVRDKAIEAVKEKEAKAAADRLTNELHSSLAEPWFDILVEPGKYKQAPDQVKKVGYYDEVIADLPLSLKFSKGVETGIIDWITQDELSDIGGIGSTSWELPGGQRLPFARLAFMVQGLQEIPEDPTTDFSLYLSLWQTSRSTLEAGDGTKYLFRVIGSAPGHEPDDLQEVRDRVVADLQLKHGMERAEEAAREFASNVGTAGLKAAWNDDPELADKVTPDDGGYTTTQRFARSFMGRRDVVPTIGQVPKSFMDEVFRLAKELNDDKKPAPAVEPLPDRAEVVVFQPMQYFPLYERDYMAQRPMLQQQFSRQQAMTVLFDWLDPKQIRERNHFEMAKEA